MILALLILIALGSVALAGWLLDHTRTTDGECDCTRCAQKRRATDERWS